MSALEMLERCFRHQPLTSVPAEGSWSDSVGMEGHEQYCIPLQNTENHSPNLVLWNGYFHRLALELKED